MGLQLQSWLREADILWPKKIARALGVKKWFGNQEVDSTIDPELCRELTDTYEGDVRELEKMLGREFPEWDNF